MYDLETTDIAKGAEIMQIGAITYDQRNSFDVYTWPEGPIKKIVTEITGLRKLNGKLVNRNDEVLPTVSLNRGISDFLSFLQEQKQYLGGRKLILVAHNAHNFDNKHLIRALMTTGNLDRARALIAGFSDTLPLMKAKYPNRKGKGAHSLSGLYEFLLGRNFDAHNAAEDVTALVQVTKAAHITASEFTTHSLTIHSAIDNLIFCDRTSTLKQTLVPLYKDRDVISDNMARKIALSGLTYDILDAVYRQGGVGQLKDLLLERLTKCSRIINAMVQYFDELHTQ